LFWTCVGLLWGKRVVVGAFRFVFCVCYYFFAEFLVFSRDVVVYVLFYILDGVLHWQLGVC